MFLRSLLAVLFAVAAAPALADQYSCETVDAGASAFVRTGLPVSIVETNRTCEIAVDGTTASGRSQNFTGAMNGLTDTLFFSEGLPYELPRDMLRDMIAGPFGDRNDREGGDWAGLVDEAMTDEAIFGFSQCIRDFTDILNGNDFGGMDTSLTQMGQMTGGPLQCVVIPDADDEDGSRERRRNRPVISSDTSALEPREPLIEGGALRLSLSAPGVMLSLYLPANWLRDARDGNGTFQ